MPLWSLLRCRRKHSITRKTFPSLRRRLEPSGALGANLSRIGLQEARARPGIIMPAAIQSPGARRRPIRPGVPIRSPEASKTFRFTESESDPKKIRVVSLDSEPVAPYCQVLGCSRRIIIPRSSAANPFTSRNCSLLPHLLPK